MTSSLSPARLRGTAMPGRTKPMRRVSAKARAVRRIWRAVFLAVAEMVNFRCQVGAPGCTGTATEGHHKQARAQGGEHSRENCLPVCANCHRWLGVNRAVAIAKGWIIERRRA